MPYIQNTLIARKRSSLSGLLDDIKDIAKGTVDFYGSAKKSQGAAEALSLQQQQAAASTMSSGPDMSTLLLLGAVGIGAVLLLKRKKS